MKKFEVLIKNKEHQKAVKEKLVDLGYKMFQGQTLTLQEHSVAYFDGEEVLGTCNNDRGVDILTLDDLYGIRIEEKCKYKMSNEEKRPEFEKVVKPVIEFINNYYHPHVKIIIDCGSAEIVEGEMTMKTEEFWKD